MIRDRPKWKAIFGVSVDAKEGAELDFSQLGGESTSGVGNTGVVWYDNENQVEKLYDNPNVGRISATDCPDTVKPNARSVTSTTRAE